MAALLAQASRESNDVSSAGAALYRVDVSQVSGGILLYRVQVTRTSDSTRWAALRTLEDFVSFDAELRSTAIFHRNPFRRGRLPALPSKRKVWALWGRRHELWVEGIPARFQQYLEKVLQRTGVRECQPVRRFLCLSGAGRSTGLGASYLPPRRRVSVQASSEAFHEGYNLQVSSLALEGQVLVPRDSYPSITQRLVQELAAEIDSVVEGDADTTVQDFSRLLTVQQGNGEPCVICQEDLLPHDDVRALACGHAYHLDCISRWLAVRSACCLCLRPAIPAEAGGPEA